VCSRRTHPQRYEHSGQDVQEAEDQRGKEDLLQAKRECGSSLRTNQTGQRFPSISPSGTGEGQSRMAIDLPGAQSPENVEKREKFAYRGVDLHENSSNQVFFIQRPPLAFPKRQTDLTDLSAWH